MNCFGCLQCVVTPDTLAQVARFGRNWPHSRSLQIELRGARVSEASWKQSATILSARVSELHTETECQGMPRVFESHWEYWDMRQTTSDIVRFKDVRFKQVQASPKRSSEVFRGWNYFARRSASRPQHIVDYSMSQATIHPSAHPHHPWRSQANWAAFKTLRGLRLGLDWVVPAKAKTQLARAGRKLREDQVDRHRREIFAKVADWPILVAKHCKLSHVRPNTAQAQRKQFCQMFTTRKPGVWSRKHCENTCESTMRV